jgi:hypothetical protein
MLKLIIKKRFGYQCSRACLHSSLQPKDRGNDVDHGGEARISLFVARGNAPKPFHLTEEIFDEMTPCVFVLVMRGTARWFPREEG